VIRGVFSANHPNIKRSYEPNHPAVPLLRTYLWVPGLGGVDDSFLVDTGADMTVLHPDDSRRLWRTEEQWDELRRRPSTRVSGAGQGVPHYHVDAIVLLRHEDGELDLRGITLYVAEPHAGNEQLESLLGRDILRHYVTTFDRLHAITLDLPQ
jgi:hypothetical protein